MLSEHISRTKSAKGRGAGNQNSYLESRFPLPLSVSKACTKLSPIPHHQASLFFTKTEIHAQGSQLCKSTPNGCLTRVGRRGGREEGTQRCASQRARPSAQQPLKPVMCFGETLHWNRVGEGLGGSETERMSEETEVGQATPISLFPANRCCCGGRGGGGGRNEEKNGESSTSVVTEVTL